MVRWGGGFGVMRRIVVVGEEVDGGVQCASIVASVGGRLMAVLQMGCRLDLSGLKRSRDWSREVLREKFVTF